MRVKHSGRCASEDSTGTAGHTEPGGRMSDLILPEFDSRHAIRAKRRRAPISLAGR